MFQDDDPGYREWIAAHPSGYVVNTQRGLGGRDGTRIHKASCFTLGPGSGGGVLQTAYVKICSRSPAELDHWARSGLGGGLRALRCQHCTPSELGLT